MHQFCNALDVGAFSQGAGRPRSKWPKFCEGDEFQKTLIDHWSNPILALSQVQLDNIFLILHQGGTILFKYEMFQDDARLVGWLLWLATHTFFATQVLFQLNKSFKWKILCLICIFLTVILHHVSDCVILGQLGKHGCPDDFKFKLLIWETVWVLGSIQERFWKQKTKMWGHFG